MARIKVPAGYHLELVASDPTIVHPVLCAWDGNGRMYVAEMRSYMRDADASRENEPISRVSRLIDSNGDGVMDQSTVFADNLVLPRMVLPLDDRVIIAETYTGKFVSYRDTTGRWRRRREEGALRRRADEGEPRAPGHRAAVGHR